MVIYIGDGKIIIFYNCLNNNAGRREIEMKNKLINKIILSMGSAIACCATMFTVISCNSACALPFYEPEQPEGLEKFNKIG